MMRILLLSSIFFQVAIANANYASERLSNRTNYKTYFGSCPSKVAGKLTLMLMKKYDETHSLLEVKKMIVDEKLDEKHFLSQYRIALDPVSDLIKFHFDCPEALMKVQIYKENGDEFYTAILGDNGKFLDPTYEVLLRGEKKIKGKLTNLAYPVKLIDTDIQEELTDLVLNLDKDFRSKISEIILDDHKKLTMIFSIDNRPSSAFLGEDYWSEKVKKLTKVIDYMKKKKTIPAVINLTNSKKVVVKFSDTI